MANPPEMPPARGAVATAPDVPVGVVDAAAADAESAATVEVAVAVVEIVELTTPLGTSLAFNVPQTGQSSEPGFSWRHCSNVARQTELGTDPT